MSTSIFDVTADPGAWDWSGIAAALDNTETDLDTATASAIAGGAAYDVLWQPEYAELVELVKAAREQARQLYASAAVKAAYQRASQHKKTG